MPTATLESPVEGRKDGKHEPVIADGYIQLGALCDRDHPPLMREVLGRATDYPVEMQWAKDPNPMPMADRIAGNGQAWVAHCKDAIRQDLRPMCERMAWLRYCQREGLLRPVDVRRADHTNQIRGYDQLGLVCGGRDGQSMRKLMMNRRNHIRADAKARGVPEHMGKPWLIDMPEPERWEGPPHKAQPVYRVGTWLTWCIQTGRLHEDGITRLDLKSPGSKGYRRMT